jgi:hypothetical protein
MTQRFLGVMAAVLVGCGNGSDQPANGGPNGFTVDGGTVSDAVAADGACTATSVRTRKPPVDVIMSIDQSGSMSDDIQQVKANINRLTDILDKSGLDARVVMIAHHGAPEPGCFYTNLGVDKCPTAETNPACWQNFEVCVPTPLGAATCGEQNLPRFFQSNFHIESTDTLRDILITYNAARADIGWKKMMRRDALKVFVPISDEDAFPNTTPRSPECYDPPASYWAASCQDQSIMSGTAPYPGGCFPTPGEFDDVLLARDPEQFGTREHRNYTMFPIVGAKAYPEEGSCSSSDGTADKGLYGQQYINLAKLLGSKWFSLCTYDFGWVFNEIAAGAVERVACELAIPAAPAGETLDYSRVNVTWTSASGDTSTIPQDISSPCATANGWQYDAVKTRILLCGDACTRARNDVGSQFDVAFGCRTVVR